MNTKRWLLVGVLFVLVGGAVYFKISRKAPQLVVYSSRPAALMLPIFEAYTAKTGVRISYLVADAPVLMERLKTEGEATPADIFVADDAESLSQAQTLGLLQPIQSEVLTSAIPVSLRDAGGNWFGYASFARTAVYHSSRVSESELSTYTQFAFPKWKGRLLLRSSRHMYNKALWAMWLNDRDESEASATLSGWVFNLAMPPFETDQQVLDALAEGKGDVGIVNSSEFAHYQQAHPKTKLRLSWLDQPVSGGFGVQVNISGAGVVAKTKKVVLAQSFLEWLVTPEAQALWAGLNNEFPVVAGVTGNATVQGFGLWYRNPIAVGKYITHHDEVMRILDGAGYE